MGITVPPGTNLHVQFWQGLIQGRTRNGVGPTVSPGTNLHVGKKFGGSGSHCTTREELEWRQFQLYHYGRTRKEVGPTVSLWKTL